MIRRLQVLHYRALKYIDVRLSNFHILVGPNASGKSTFLDAINLIGDVLNESPHAAIEDRSSGFDELLWMGQGNKFEIAVELEIPKDVKERSKDKGFSLVRYEISLQLDNKKGVIISGENLWLIKEALASSSYSSRDGRALFPIELEEPTYIIFPTSKRSPSGWRKVISKSVQGKDYFKSETTDWNITYKFGPLKSSLARIPEDEERFPISLWAKNVLMEGIQFLQLNSSVMRWSCRPDLPMTFQADGSNLPKVVQHLKKEHPVFYGWLSLSIFYVFLKPSRGQLIWLGVKTIRNLGTGKEVWTLQRSTRQGYYNDCERPCRASAR
jgi:energy-coupling factor transporter ATP-binding protein EcfA2